MSTPLSFDERLIACDECIEEIKSKSLGLPFEQFLNDIDAIREEETSDSLELPSNSKDCVRNLATVLGTVVLEKFVIQEMNGR